GVVEPDPGLVERAAIERRDAFVVRLVRLEVAFEPVELEIDVGPEDGRARQQDRRRHGQAAAIAPEPAGDPAEHPLPGARRTAGRRACPSGGWRATARGSAASSAAV